MKKCPECAELVQDDARICRYCRHEFGTRGQPLEFAPLQQKKPKEGRPRWGCIGLGIVALVLIGIAGGNEPSATTDGNGSDKQTGAIAEGSEGASSENPYADVGKQYAWIEVGKDEIRKVLKDPDSAVFRSVRFYSGGGVPVTCGEVNARNGFGGYTGFERFVAAGSSIAATESQVTDGLDAVWDKFCVRAPQDRAEGN